MKLRAGVKPQDIPIDTRLGLIIFLRFAGHWTYQEIGDLFGVSRQRIHQIISVWEEDAHLYMKGSWFFSLDGTPGKPMP